MRRLLLAGISLALLSACGVTPVHVESLPSTAAEPSSLAPAPSKSAKVLSGRTVVSYFSPPKDYPGPAWTKDGSKVSQHELNSAAGLAHCDWQSVVMMHLGWPLGTVARHYTQSRQFIRDPQGILEWRVGEKPGIHVDLPADASDTGYRVGDLELWLSASQTNAAFLKVDNDVESWPLVEGDPIACK